MKEINFFENKVIVITGAGGVLCGGFAKELAGYGAKIALLDRNIDAAESVAQDIRNQGGIAYAYKTDVLNKDNLLCVKEKVNKDFGYCDILINGAGGNSPKATTDEEYFVKERADTCKTFFALEESGFEFVFNLNILGTLLPSQVFIPDMIGREGCSVLNISSMNAFTPLTKIPAYSAAKAGVSNLTQWLAVHFSKEKIRVNALAPGFFVTKQNEALLFEKDGTPTARTGKILSATPLQRFGKAEELYGALRFLLDASQSSFVTGIVLPVDGGFSAYSGV